jgi:osmotically-inducible protein OsmY
MSRRSQLLRRVLVAVALAQVGCSTPAARAEADEAGAAIDAATQVRVAVILANDPALSGRLIGVRVQDGVVHLRGFVHSISDLWLVRADAKSVPHVVAVDLDQLAIISGGTPP